MGRVAVLGMGIMGGPMARNLLRAGHEVTVWNRTVQKTEALEEEGARVASTPADAVRDAEIVLTMLADAPAVEATVIESGGFEAMPQGALARSRTSPRPSSCRRSVSILGASWRRAPAARWTCPTHT